MNSGGWRKQTGRDGITPWLEKDVGWWTLADDYKENALEALARYPSCTGGKTEKNVADVFILISKV